MRSILLGAALVAAFPLAGQARRPQPKAFPLAVSGSLVLNAFGTRANELDALVLQCTTVTNCIEHGLGRGPGVGLSLQLPLAGNLGFGLGMDAMTMVRQQCIPGGNCSTSDRLLGLRARGELLFRLKARAPIYFGLGAAALRTDPGALEPQTDPTVDVGGVVTIGGDFAAGPRWTVRVAWHSYFMRADAAGLPGTFETRTAHDGVITIGGRYALVP